MNRSGRKKPFGKSSRRALGFRKKRTMKFLGFVLFAVVLSSQNIDGSKLELLSDDKNDEVVFPNHSIRENSAFSSSVERLMEMLRHFEAPPSEAQGEDDMSLEKVADEQELSNPEAEKDEKRENVLAAMKQLIESIGWNTRSRNLKPEKKEENGTSEWENVPPTRVKRDTIPGAIFDFLSSMMSGLVSLGSAFFNPSNLKIPTSGSNGGSMTVEINS